MNQRMLELAGPGRIRVTGARMSSRQGLSQGLVV